MASAQFDKILNMDKKRKWFCTLGANLQLFGKPANIFEVRNWELSRKGLGPSSHI